MEVSGYMISDIRKYFPLKLCWNPR